MLKWVISSVNRFGKGVSEREMGQPGPPEPVLLLLAAFSRYEEALAWARDRAAQAWGPIALESATFEFSQTDYYEATMGSPLKKLFFALAQPIAPDRLAGVKLQTNEWERDYAALDVHPEPRPLNLDPGYIAPGKLVLASTKDHAHRIYLAHGIYAEATLQYKHRRWHAHPWTYADYRREDYQQFFSACRDYLHRQMRERPWTAEEGKTA